MLGMNDKKEACSLCKEVIGSIEIKLYNPDEWVKSDCFKEFCKPATKKFQNFSDYGCKGKDVDCSNYIKGNAER